MLLRVILTVVSVPPTTPHPFTSLFLFYLLIFFCIFVLNDYGCRFKNDGIRFLLMFISNLLYSSMIIARFSIYVIQFHVTFLNIMKYVFIVLRDHTESTFFFYPYLITHKNHSLELRIYQQISR